MSCGSPTPTAPTVAVTNADSQQPETVAVAVTKKASGGRGEKAKYVPVHASIQEAVDALNPSRTVLEQIDKRRLKMNLADHQASLAVVARNTGNSMLRSALFAALARLAFGLSKTLLKGGFSFSKRFFAILSKEMSLGNPIKWGILCAGLSSYRLLQQVLLRIGEEAVRRLRAGGKKQDQKAVTENGGEEETKKYVVKNTTSPKIARVAASFGAGMLASLPFLALNVHTRAELSLYLCIRAMHGIVCTYWERMPVPESVKRFNHYDVVTMGLTSAEIIYALVMQGNTHVHGYQEFLLSNTKMPRNALQAIACFYRRAYVPEALGIDQDYGRLGPLLSGGEMAVSSSSSATAAVSNVVLNATTDQLHQRFDPHHIPNICLYTHPQEPSCILNYLKYLFKHITTVSIPLYLPLKVMSTLVFGMKKLKKDPLGVTLKVTKGILSSSAFLTLYASSPVGSVCAFSNIWVGYPPILVGCSGIFSALATLLEPKGRRLDLALYCSVQTLRSMTRLLHVRGYIPRPTSSWIFVLQTLSVGMVLYQYDNHADILHPNLKGTLGWLLRETPRSPADRELQLLEYIETECSTTTVADVVTSTPKSAVESDEKKDGDASSAAATPTTITPRKVEDF